MKLPKKAKGGAKWLWPLLLALLVILALIYFLRGREARKLLMLHQYQQSKQRRHGYYCNSEHYTHTRIHQGKTAGWYRAGCLQRW